MILFYRCSLTDYHSSIVKLVEVRLIDTKKQMKLIPIIEWQNLNFLCTYS